MPFRFTLESVLAVRAGFERLERNRLLLIAAALMRIRESLEFLAKDYAAAQAATLEKLAACVPSGELELDRLLQQAMRDRRRSLQARESELLAKQKSQHRIYLAAKTRREILDELRSRRLTQYRASELRREQQRVDELFLLRRIALSADSDE
jgi:flagellar export protein FliJ